MRVSSCFCWMLAGGAFACRPVGDLDATRRGSSGVVSPSDSASSEPPTPFTPPATTGANSEATPDHSSAVTLPVASNSTTTPRGVSSADNTDGASDESEPPTLETSTRDFVSVSSGTSLAVTSEQGTIGEITSEVSDTTEAAAPVCNSKCGMGETCEDLTDCLSLRCDGVCQPTELVVQSDGLDAVSTSIKMHVELYADPSVAVAWQDLAVLYFITVEKHDDFKLNFAQGGGTAMPMQVTLEDWILVWTTDATGNVPSTVTPFDVQIHSYPWLQDVPESNDNSNDHSYRSELGVNDKIVLCRRVEGQWRHAQGTPPASVADPCRYVDNCEAALSCDPLEPSPSE